MMAEKLNLDESTYVRRVFKIIDYLNAVNNAHDLVTFELRGTITKELLLENFKEEFEQELILLNLGDWGEWTIFEI